MPVSLRAFKLRLEVLVLSTFFLLLVEVSTRVLMDVVVVRELPRVDVLLLFFDEAELDFFILPLYCDAE